MQIDIIAINFTPALMYGSICKKVVGKSSVDSISWQYLLKPPNLSHNIVEVGKAFSVSTPSNTANLNYGEVIICARVSESTGIWLVCWTVCSRANHRKHQWSSSPASVCEGNPPVAGWFPSQRDTNAENVFMRCRQPVFCLKASTINRG